MTGPAPTLTIGVPVFNGERYLERAVRSVLDQSFTDLELIISDNASSDHTADIGQALAASDERVTYRRNARNIGLAANNNLLVRHARGRLFKWANCDDELRPGYLERCVAALDHDPRVVLAYPQTDFVDADGELLDIVDPGWELLTDDVAERLRFAIVSDRWMNAVLGVIRTDALRHTRLMRRYAGSDARLMAELATLGTFVEIPDHLFIRRIHQGSTKGRQGDTRWLRIYYSGARTQLGLPFWRLSADRAEIVVRAPIPLGSKASLLGLLARHLVASRRRLYQDLVDLRG